MSDEDWIVRWEDEGRYKTWFEWVEWMLVSSALLALWSKASSLPLQIGLGAVGFWSTILVYNCGVVRGLRFIRARIPQLYMPKWLAVVIALPVGIGLSSLIMFAMYSVISAALR